MIVFRCDGGDRVGAGHVARCLQIALAFRAGGDEVVFAGDYDGLAADLLAAARIATVAADEQPGSELTVFDSYEAPRPEQRPLAVISDEPGELPEGAIGIDYHLDARDREIAGAAYAPVPPALLGARRDRGFERVLVTVGGGSAGRELRERAVAACRERGLELVPPAIGLAVPVAAADVAVGTAGVTAYELACAGLPAALVPVAREQERVARTFAEAGIAITGADVAELVARLAGAEVRAALAERGPATVDGYGAFRVRDALRAILNGQDPPAPVLYRPGGTRDAAALRDWRNDPEARAVSRTTHEIGADEHERWLSGVLTDPYRTLLVAETADGPAGSVRFDVAGDEAEISVVVAPQRRGEGLGKRMVRESSELILAALGSLERVRADVGEGNERSARAFRGAGFAPAGDGASPLFLDRTALASRPTVMSLLDGKTVLVTGGTGSFGTRFIETALRDHDPQSIRLFSRDELKQSELQRRFADESRLRYLLGDVRDLPRLTRATRGVDVIVHAAALKQVPAAEYNPFEAVQTNVVGAENVVAAAIENDVPHTVALSTDKAVNPVNLYGATKLCAEKIVAQGNAYSADSPARFSSVRYGNVVGSRGSVIPLFKAQAETGVLTITDERMTRFWITLDQAVDFVMNSLATMGGGEVYVPKIPSMRVTDMAEAIAPDAELRIIGIRPGEKLHEMLVTEDESRHSYELDDRYVILPEYASWELKEPGGSRMEDGFRFTSDTNESWLDVEELREMAAGVAPVA